MWKVRSCLLRVCLESNLLTEFEYIRLYLILADTKTLRFNKLNSANGNMTQLTKCRKNRFMFLLAYAIYIVTVYGELYVWEIMESNHKGG